MRDGKGTITRPKLMTHVYDVVKFGLTSTSESTFAKRPILVTVSVVLMTTARDTCPKWTGISGYVVKSHVVTIPYRFDVPFPESVPFLLLSAALIFSLYGMLVGSVLFVPPLSFLTSVIIRLILMITDLTKVALFSTAIFDLTGSVLYYQKQAEGYRGSESSVLTYLWKLRKAIAREH